MLMNIDEDEYLKVGDPELEIPETVIKTPPIVSLIIPTRNESGNVHKLLERIQNCVREFTTEVIFVDDSTDNTPEVIHEAAVAFPELNVSLIHRPAEQRTGGLGGAVVEGFRKARAEYMIVMDGDLQHPPEMIPRLFEKAQTTRADLVAASRRTGQSEVKGLNTTRNLISKVLDLIARMLFPQQLQGVSDPLTGFFLVRRSAIKIDSLRPQGFKILLEILVRNPWMLKTELPFEFGERFTGKSKASAREALKYFNLLWNLRFGERSLRFAGFALIGLSGILVNSAAIALFTDVLNIYYLISAVLATLVSTLWNFSLTETLVYRSGEQNAGRLKRLGMFTLMNSAALLFRSPLIYLLTSILGMHYLISNLLSLGLLTVLRFLLADQWIWGQRPAERMGSD